MFLSQKPNRPDIFIVGTMKGGTTVLHEFLALHPQIHAGTKKEIHYFSLNEANGPDWYHAHFEDLPPNQHYLDASPTYFDMTMGVSLPSRINLYNPEARVIMMARNPVERALSHFQHFRKVNKIEALMDMTADEFFSRDLEQAIGGTSMVDACLMHTINFSLYYRKAHVYRKVFGDRFLAVENSRLGQRPQETMETIFRHLGVDPIASDAFGKRKYSNGSISLEQLSRPVLARLSKLFREDYHAFCRMTGIEPNWNIAL